MTTPTFPAFARELRRLSRGAGWNLVAVRRTASSNLLARRVSREFTGDGLQVPAVAVVAFEQTSGRGRLGRAWVSPPGAGVYASLLLPAPAPEALPALPMVAPLALCAVLDRHLPTPTRLKWPNDVLVSGRKIGGVLIETSLRPDGSGEVIVGFGVNHAPLSSELATSGATSVCDQSGSPPGLGVLTWELLQDVGAALRAPGEPAVASRRYLERSVHRQGDRLRCALPARQLEGRFLGLTVEGFLRLEVDGREEVVSAAEVVEG